MRKVILKHIYIKILLIVFQLYCIFMLIKTEENKWFILNIGALIIVLNIKSYENNKRTL